MLETRLRQSDAGAQQITPAQILWVNMVTAVTLAMALAFEPMEAKIMERQPRKPGEPILNTSLLPA